MVTQKSGKEKITRDLKTVKTRLEAIKSAHRSDDLKNKALTTEAWHFLCTHPSVMSTYQHLPGSKWLKNFCIQQIGPIGQEKKLTPKNRR